MDLGMEREPQMDTAAENMKRMVVLDDAWNAQDRSKIAKLNKEDVVVYRPGRSLHTRGIKDHDAEACAYFKTFPDQNLDNRPYIVLFASGDWTTSIARFRGTMTGPM